MKRALFLFPTDRMGGAEQVTRNVAEAALESGSFDKVICFVLSRKDTGTLAAINRHPKGCVIHTHAGGEAGGVLRLLWQLAKHRYEFVFSSHGHLNATTSLMRRIGVLRTARLVTRESTLIFERKLDRLTTALLQLYRFYGTQDLIVCQTQRMAASFNSHTSGRFSDRTVTLPNPVSMDRIDRARALPADPVLGIPPERTKIVWCGRFSRVKNPQLAIDVLALVHSTGHKNAHLVMIGDGTLKGDTQAHAIRLGLAGHVTFTGQHPAPPALMQHCDIGLVTSDLEGFPNVILEMLASGLPVLTTDCAGNLHEMPGVHVVGDTNARAIAAVFGDVLHKRVDGPALMDFLASRSPSVFLQAVLTGAAPGADEQDCLSPFVKSAK